MRYLTKYLVLTVFLLGILSGCCTNWPYCNESVNNESVNGGKPKTRYFYIEKGIFVPPTCASRFGRIMPMFYFNYPFQPTADSTVIVEMIVPLPYEIMKSTGEASGTVMVKLNSNLEGESFFVGGGPKIDLFDGVVVETGTYTYPDGKTVKVNNLSIDNLAVQSTQVFMSNCGVTIYGILYLRGPKSSFPIRIPTCDD